MNNPVIMGVGMTPFTTPKNSRPYDEMAEGAIRVALHDAGIGIEDVQQAYASFVYGDSTSGQRALYRVGMTGLPVVNVNNNCSSGSSALWLAAQTVRSGAADCALAFGFEQMRPGPLGSRWDDRPSPIARFVESAEARFGPVQDVPHALFLFGAAGADYMERTGAAPETFAQITVKARRHAKMNPNAVFRDQLTVDDVLSSPLLFQSLHRLEACPPTNGSAAVVVCSEDFARSHGADSGVRILGQGFATDTPDSVDPEKLQNAVGFGISAAAAQQAYEQAGIGPEDADVVELHDCFTVNEILSYEALGLTPEGTAERFVRDGDNTFGGKVVVNPSGGLLSKGHPLGATGLAQVTEVTWQLRGAASGGRQVENAKIGVQHNAGLGGAAVVTVLG